MDKESQQRNFDRPEVWGQNYWNKTQYDRAAQTVKMLPSDTRTVLDVGCGAGIVTMELEKSYELVIGTDYAFSPLQQLSKKGYSVVQSNAATLPFPSRSFDAVVLTEVIEHFNSPLRQKAIDEIIRVARKYILLTTPYREVLESSQVKCEDCGTIFHAWYHTLSFDETNLSDLFLPAFELVQTQTMGPTSGRPPAKLIRLAQVFDGYMRVPAGRTTCPTCGNSERFLRRRTPMASFFLGVARLFQIKKTPRWIATLYRES